jgi:drug/metabolite transporter (DMT)-like permease
MNLFTLAMSLTVLANVVYHLCQKGIAPAANPIASLIASYTIALVLALGCFSLLYPRESLFGAMRTLNAASYVLSLGLVGLELGFLLAYRAGWNLSVGALFSNVAVTLILIPIGILLYREPIGARKAIGIAFALTGLVLMSRR